MKSLPMIFVLVALSCGDASGQQAREKPKELEALGPYVGDWTSDVTSKRAEWTPREIKYRTTNHALLALNGWFLMHSEVNHLVDDPSQVAKSLFVWTYDSSLKKYVGWSFQSSGNISKVTGSWDAASKTFTHAESEPPASTTSKLTETFVSKDAITGSLSFTRNDGLKLFDMVWTRNRRPGLPDPATQDQWAEQWAMIGKPIQPIPSEVKKLEPFIGRWNVENSFRPSVAFPEGKTTKGTMSGQWILDGRFLFGESDAGNVQSQWVIGYDTSKSAYRYVRFSSVGQLEENIGQWNAAAKSFEWKGVATPPGVTRSSTNRLIGDDAVESHIVIKNPAGQTQVDLTTKATRRK